MSLVEVVSELVFMSSLSLDCI